jgi:hypothetical protein
MLHCTFGCCRRLISRLELSFNVTSSNPAGISRAQAALGDLEKRPQPSLEPAARGISRSSPQTTWVATARSQRGCRLFDRAQIETRPRKYIDLFQNDPGALAIETQVLLHPKRNFDGDVRVMGWAVCNRHNRHLLASVRLRIRIINGENNGARPILAPLGLPSLLFFFLKI